MDKGRWNTIRSGSSFKLSIHNGSGGRGRIGRRKAWAAGRRKINILFKSAGGGKGGAPDILEQTFIYKRVRSPNKLNACPNSRKPSLKPVSSPT